MTTNMHASKDSAPWSTYCALLKVLSELLR